MTVVPIISKPVHWFVKQIDGLFLYDKDLHHERVNGKSELLSNALSIREIRTNVPNYMKQIIYTPNFRKTEAKIRKLC